MSDTNKKKSKRQPIVCICDWEDCADLHKRCMEVLPDNHEWKNKINRYRLSLNPTNSGTSDAVKIKNESFINRSFSLLNASEKQNKSDFYIALHHFSKSMLANTKLGKTVHKPETGQTMKRYDEDAVYGCAGHKDDRNLLRNNYKLDVDNKNHLKYKDLYVQAPIVPRGKVLEEIEYYSKPGPTREYTPANVVQVESATKKNIIDVDAEIKGIKEKLDALIPNVEYNKNDKKLVFSLRRIANDTLFLCKSIKTFPTSIKLNSGRIYHVCMCENKSEDCNLFQLLKIKGSDKFNCDNCKYEKKKKYQRDLRKELR